MAFHTQGECFQPLQQKERVERADGGAGIPHQRCAQFDDISQGTRNLCEHYPMVGRVWPAESGELVILRPVKPTAVHDHAAHYRSVTADKLGGRVDYNVRAMFYGAEQIRRRERIVDQDRNTVLVSNSSDGFQIQHVGVGVAERFQKERPGVGTDCPAEVLGVASIHKRRFNTGFAQRVGKQVVGASVKRFGGHDMIARAGNVANCVIDCRRTGRGGQRRRAAFQSGNAFFKYVRGGIHQARIDIAAFREAETPRGLCGVLEHIGGCCINRNGSRVGGGIRVFLTHMKLQGFKPVLVYRHG